jgi:hypothetical protein
MLTFAAPVNSLMPDRFILWDRVASMMVIGAAGGAWICRRGAIRRLLPVYAVKEWPKRGASKAGRNVPQCPKVNSVRAAVNTPHASGSPPNTRRN